MSAAKKEAAPKAEKAAKAPKAPKTKKVVDIKDAPQNKGNVASQERLINLLTTPHITEKTSLAMQNANTRYAIARPSTNRELIQRDKFCAPPSAHQAPNTNSSCQANGLKTHVPLGHAGRFHSKNHIRT